MHPVLGMIMRICGGSAAFLLAKGWGFYPASSVALDEGVFSRLYVSCDDIFG